jgi:hypothetical protein
MTLPKENPMTADDLTLERLTELVGEARGWDDHANITFRRENGRVSVSVEICGSKATVSASGVDHCRALVTLLQNIEMHHREILRWHKQRCERTRTILDAHAIYYVKGDL